MGGILSLKDKSLAIDIIDHNKTYAKESCSQMKVIWIIGLISVSADWRVSETPLSNSSPFHSVRPRWNCAAHCAVVPSETSGASMTLPRGSTSISPHWRRVRRGLVTCRRENDGIRHISSWHWHLPVTCHSLCYSDPCAQFSGFVCLSFVSLGWERKLPTQIIWLKWSWSTVC